MNYGFVIDQRKCIGCHACTTACKSENDVPIGTFRTWVKYVEKGEFPNTRRYFSVMRCNHCDNAPCVTICPTRALFRRDDGIVDFDQSRCIGCKSCMQACPYDAIFINPDSNTAEKCNYCAHRVEVGLEPACVIVCPEHAIISGDIEDPMTEIARLIAREQVRVRAPEQGTKPKLFYIGVDEVAITPDATDAPTAYMWSEAAPAPGRAHMEVEPKGSPEGGLGHVVYNVFHRRPWGLLVSLYLWTKSIGSGSLLVAALAIGLGVAQPAGALAMFAPIVALAFTGLTLLLLVADLKRPARFWYILTKSNWTSWLVWGGYILAAFGLVSLTWLYAAFAGEVWLVQVLLWPAGVLAACSACYSAFLFGQAEGRDFWQNPMVAWHLLVQAVLAGAAIFGVGAIIFGANSDMPPFVSRLLAGSIALSTLIIFAELSLPHANSAIRRATELILAGPLSTMFWGVVIVAGTLVPMGLLIWGSATNSQLLMLPIAGLLALAGLLVYEDIWVRAGQSAPLS